MDLRIEKALETWHGGNGERGLNDLALSLVAETGEIINLYRKQFFQTRLYSIQRKNSR